MGLNLEWDYDKRTVTLFMPGYVKRALKGFAHSFEDAPHQDSPYDWHTGHGPGYIPETGQENDKTCAGSY